MRGAKESSSLVSTRPEAGIHCFQTTRQPRAGTIATNAGGGESSLSRLCVLINLAFSELSQGRVGLLFFGEGRLQKLDGLVQSQLSRPGL
jgi:hypothetical protein